MLYPIREQREGGNNKNIFERVDSGRVMQRVQSGIQNERLSHYMQGFGLFGKYCADGLTVGEKLKFNYVNLPSNKSEVNRQVSTSAQFLER